MTTAILACSFPFSIAVAIASRLLPLPEASTPRTVTELELDGFLASDKISGELTNLRDLYSWGFKLLCLLYCQYYSLVRHESFIGNVTSYAGS